MSIQLNLDEMLEALQTLDSEAAQPFRLMLESTGTLMAATIARLADCECGYAEAMGTAFAGTCAPFRPRYRFQPVPDALEPFDSGGQDDWREQAADVMLPERGEED